MSKSGFVGGMVAGMLVGSAITMVIDPINDRQHKKMSRTAGGMFKNIGIMIDSVMGM